MKKELKIFKPLLSGRLHITYPMIAFMQHKDGETFLYNSFLNIECWKEGYDLGLCYTTLIEKENCYDLHHINIHKEYEDFLEEKKMDLISAIIDENNKENYVYIAFDDFYLPDKIQKHNLHINMIYGYDDDKRIFFSVGYDGEGNYRKLLIPFEAAEKAFTSYRKVEVYRPNYDVDYTFDKQYFLLQVQDFLASEHNFVTEEEMNECFLNKKDFFYGLKVYDRVAEHLLQHLDGENLDFRNIHQLYELSLLNMKRMVYLKENLNFNIPDEFIEMSSEIFKISEIMRNFTLKSQIKNDKSLIKNVLEYLFLHREKNVYFYKQLLNVFE
ncbi:MAG: hypothetical protein ACLTWK_05860 [Eisenbergiella sp.]